MAQRNTWISLAAAAALALGSASASSVALAHSAATEGASSEGSAADQTPAYEPVDSFVIFPRITQPSIASPYSWNRVDDRTVVIWTSAFTAYLVELAYPSNDMRFVQAIGVTSSGSRVYAKFDAVLIRGFRYPIKNIYKLSREEAKNLARDHERSHAPKNS